MISEHQKFLQTKHSWRLAKQAELEAARLEYLEKTRKIIDKYDALQRRHHFGNLGEEVTHAINNAQEQDVSLNGMKA